MFILFVQLSFGQQMRVGLFRSSNIQSIDFTINEGGYTIFGDSILVYEIKKTEKVTLSIHPDGVHMHLSEDGGYFLYDTLRFIKNSDNSSAMLRGVIPSTRAHIYEDDFIFSYEKYRLNIVNEVSMENYLSGVVESEGGGGRHIEYYKVQALMSRTYAFQNKKRHKKDGFEMCDGVHCQAYHHMLKSTPTIRDAVKKTKGEVMVKKNGAMVTTFFHANCGGQTSDASYVWNNSIPYCKPFVDTFCIHTRQATWVKYIDKSKWINYLVKEYGFDSNNSQLIDLAFDFNQKQRKAFYIHPSLGIPLRDLRSNFRLKSTFFNVSLEGEQVRIDGKGFGHGVGLCQEGAMIMAKKGYTYQQIAMFYFSGISIINYVNRDFFEQDKQELSN